MERHRPRKAHAAVVLALAVLIGSSCGAGKLSAAETERQLAEVIDVSRAASGRPQISRDSFHCTKGANGWDYVCAYHDPSVAEGYGTPDVAIAVKVNGNRILFTSGVFDPEKLPASKLPHAR